MSNERVFLDFESYRILVDADQFILQRRHFSEGKSGEYFRGVGYYGNLDSLLQGLMKEELATTDIQEFKSWFEILVKEIKAITPRMVND